MKSATQHRGHTTLIAGIGVLLALVLPTVAALLLDPRELRGLSVWDKPLKFELSLALHLVTLLVAVRSLPARLTSTERSVVQHGMLAVAVCCVLEILYIVLQAARGRESHFNRETPPETLLYYGAMGTGALVIVVGAGLLGAVLWRHARDSRASGLAYGMALGLLVGSVATLIAVAPLSSGMVDGLGHWVGGPHTDIDGLPLTGWSTHGGDLRVPHFFATHLMQAVPTAGWLADRLAPAQRRRWPRLMAALGVIIVLATMGQAIAGRPFFVP